MTIYGDNDLTSGQTSVYDCFASFEDGSVDKVSPTWTVQEGSIESTGMFTAPNVTSEKLVTIHAEYEDENGQRASGDFQVRITPNAGT